MSELRLGEPTCPPRWLKTGLLKVLNPALVNSTTRREKVQKNAVNCGMANRGEYIRNEKV